MRAIHTIEQALAYPSERVRAVALQMLSQMPLDSPKTHELLQMAAAYAPDMGYSNQRRVSYLCRCAEGSLSGDDDDDSDDEEGTDWAEAFGKGIEALFNGGTKLGVAAIQADAAQKQQELMLKITQAKSASEAAALQRQAQLAAQAAQAKVAAAQAAASKAKAKKATSTGSGHFQKHWGKYLAGTTVTALLVALGMYLYKQRQQTQAA